MIPQGVRQRSDGSIRLPVWSEERIALLRALWIAGFSSRQIADALNARAVTRGSVMGQVHRLGLTRRYGHHKAEARDSA
jgi:hypothetical protein